MGPVLEVSGTVLPPATRAIVSYKPVGLPRKTPKSEAGHFGAGPETVRDKSAPGLG